MYFVRFNTGAGDFRAESLEEAMEEADRFACYTQQDIVIEDERGNEVARRAWVGVGYEDDGYTEDPIIFGSFGYYDDWR